MLTLVSESLLSGAQSAEVFSSLGHDISSQLHGNSAHGVATGGEVKENTR